MQTHARKGKIPDRGYITPAPYAILPWGKIKVETNAKKRGKKMSLVGAGNWWPKKDKFSICPNCGKKGYYTTSMVDKKNRIHRWSSCMKCHETEILETH